jgi:choline dehydrogenase-like flavoprotein
VIIDARRLPAGHTIEADLCVVGAGPAGLTLAREFEGTATRVVLIESGGFDVDDDIQSLNDGTTISTHHLEDALRDGRRRQFGGTTNLWVHHTDPDDGRRHARMLLPEAIDFTDWPVDRETLLPFFERAHHTCRLGPWSYDTGRWSGGGPGPWPFARATTVVCHYCASDVFTRRYRDDAKVSANVTVLQNATVVAIEAGRDRSTVECVRAARLDGRSVRVLAHRFVLAGGGIENPRLLLASDLGNGHDVVGRYVMDHPEFRLGVIEPDDPQAFGSMAFYDLRWVDGVMVSGLLTLREDVKRSEQLKNLCCMVVAKSKGAGSETEKAVKSAVLAARGRDRRAALRHAARAVARLDETAAIVSARTVRRTREYTEFHAGWSQRTGDEPRFRVLELIAATEQSPHADNRLALSGRRDRLGLPAVELHWRWHEADQRSVLRTRDILSDEVERAGLGRFRPWVDLEGPTRPSFPGIHHPMGATRMHPDPRHGVVDEQCKVHGVTNLFVAGSSVFPTALGYANPTLTLVALATRLADHLKALAA